MAFGNPYKIIGTLSTQGQYNVIISNPPSGLQRISLEGWDSNNPSYENVLIFKVTQGPGVRIQVTLGADPSTLVVNVSSSANAPAAENWWGVDVGPDPRTIGWKINYTLQNAGTNVGTWIFVKSAVFDG